MMIGPAPMMRIVEMSVRLGIGFLGSPSRRTWAHKNAPSRLEMSRKGRKLSGDERGIGLPRSLAENGAMRKGVVGEANFSLY